MDMEPKLFLDVPLDLNGPTACSPKVPDSWDWRGIIINAPKKVWFKPGEKVEPYGAFVAVPICGYDFTDLRPDVPARKIILVAVDKATGVKLSGPIVPLDPSPIDPPPLSPPLTAKQLEGHASVGYFNVNLADYIKLPQKSAVYDVLAEFHEFKSNVVSIELILVER